jgi:hypothetical protein
MSYLRKKKKKQQQELQKHYAGEKKPDTKGSILCDSIL